jgi:adenosylcobinamide-GDP ribazoletransferase
MRRASGYYPLVGWLLGGLLYLAARAFGALWPAGVAAAAVLFLWLLLTGMLHLDGLLDAADALLAPADREGRLRILRDLRIGSFAFGVGAAHLLLKFEAIAASPTAVLLAAPAFARFAVLVFMNRFPAARKEGLGASAREGRVGLGLLFALPVFALWPIPSLLAFAALLALGLFAHARLGGLTGDVYGALIELGEVAFLLAALA